MLYGSTSGDRAREKIELEKRLAALRAAGIKENIAELQKRVDELSKRR